MSLSADIVSLFFARNRAGVPKELRERAKLHVADAVGIAIGAGRLPISQQVIDAASTGGASGNCGVIGTERCLPPAEAAFVNSALIHALDYDDVHDAARTHPTPVAFPAALAASQVAGDSSSHLIWDAVVLGNELMCRMGLALDPMHNSAASNYFMTQVGGYLGGALASAIVLGLSEEQTVSALGLAYMQIAGGKEAGFGVGSTARAIYPAFAASAAVQASLLARSGVIGPSSALDGRSGLFRIIAGTDVSEGQKQLLLNPDGWAWSEILIKPWPSCRYTHPYLAAAFDVRRRVAASAINKIIISVNPTTVALCRPLADRCRPQTLPDAKYSIPFMTAFALVHGDVNLRLLGPDAIADAAVLDLASRVEVRETLPDNIGLPRAQVAVETAGGTITSETDAVPQFTGDELRVKFLDCLEFAGQGSVATTLWDSLMRLDEIGVGPLFSNHTAALKRAS